MDGFSAVNNLLTYSQATGRIIEDDYGHNTDKAFRLTVTVEENVLVQVENLRTLPGVASYQPAFNSDAAIARSETRSRHSLAA